MANKVLVWLLRADGHALLLRRDRPPSVPGWHPVTGNVDPGEDLVAAAAREVLEETGFAVEPVDLGLESSFERYGRVRSERAFFAVVEGEPRLSGEHDGFSWAEPEEALARLAFEPQRAALRAALARIGRPI